MCKTLYPVWFQPGKRALSGVKKKNLGRLSPKGLMEKTAVGYLSQPMEKTEKALDI
jgi:hypothetical protein